MAQAGELKKQISEAVAFIRSKSPVTPKVGIILGTGMGAMAGDVADSTVIDYGTIPHFPVSTVESHAV